MSTTTTTPVAAPSAPDILKQTEVFLTTIPQRKSEIERLRVKERLADTELFNAKRTLLQAQEAVKLAGVDDPQIEEHRHFEAQAAAAVAQAHLNLQQTRLKLVEEETSLHKADGRDLLEPLRSTVIEHQSDAIAKFLRDFASSGFQKTLQRGFALAAALGVRLDQPLPLTHLRRLET